MNGVIATWYARNTKKSIEEYKGRPKGGGRAVGRGGDSRTGSGTGYLSIELAKLGNFASPV